MSGYAPSIKWDKPVRTVSSHCTDCPWSHSYGDLRATRRHIMLNSGHRVEVVSRTSTRLWVASVTRESVDVAG